MNNSIIAVAVLALTFTFVGCIRGQFAGHSLDPNQVKTITGANGATEYHLILPIKGKPYASGAQFVYDQLVAQQAGGDVRSITVDPSTVEILFSHEQYGQGTFVMSGTAQVALTNGLSFSASFEEVVTGGAQDDRIFSVYGFEYIPEVTAYREGLASWTAKAVPVGSDHIYQSDAIQAQLSIAMLVKEITSDGTVKTDALQEWKRANQIAWSKRSVLGL